MRGCCVASGVRHSQSGRSVKRVGCVVSGTTPISTCASAGDPAHSAGWDIRKC